MEFIEIICEYTVKLCRKLNFTQEQKNENMGEITYFCFGLVTKKSSYFMITKFADVKRTLIDVDIRKSTKSKCIDWNKTCMDIKWITIRFVWREDMVWRRIDYDIATKSSSLLSFLDSLHSPWLTRNDVFQITLKHIYEYMVRASISSGKMCFIFSSSSLTVAIIEPINMYISAYSRVV